jgi:hypothetical protein
MIGNHNTPNFISNAILLRSDVHKLFDSGYVTITKDYKVEVSKRIKEEFETAGNIINITTRTCYNRLIENWTNQMRGILSGIIRGYLRDEIEAQVANLYQWITAFFWKKHKSQTCASGQIRIHWKIH